VSKTDLDLTLNGPSDRERLLTRLGNTIKVTPQTKNLFSPSPIVTRAPSWRTTWSRRC
jgi:hypothetical protein